MPISGIFWLLKIKIYNFYVQKAIMIRTGAENGAEVTKDVERLLKIEKKKTFDFPGAP